MGRKETHEALDVRTCGIREVAACLSGTSDSMRLVEGFPGLWALFFTASLRDSTGPGRFAVGFEPVRGGDVLGTVGYEFECPGQCKLGLAHCRLLVVRRIG